MKIKTTDMVRRIRDTHREQTRGMTPRQRAEFYMQKAEEFRKKGEQRDPEPPKYE